MIRRCIIRTTVIDRKYPFKVSIDQKNLDLHERKGYEGFSLEERILILDTLNSYLHETYGIKEVQFTGIGFSLIVKTRYLTDNIFETLDKMGFVWLTVYRRKDSFRIYCHMKLNL